MTDLAPNYWIQPRQSFCDSTQQKHHASENDSLDPSLDD